VGVEPTGDRKTCRPPVLKTGPITGLDTLPFSIYNTLAVVTKDLLHVYCMFTACLV
jgi:hypothetical protein